jgi:hypothetical protein
MRTADQPIRITLIAPNGRMGKAIAAVVADDSGFTIDQDHGDVLVDFSAPAALQANLDRAVSELTRDLGLPADSFTEAVDSVTLGARGRVAPAAIDGETAVVILEPSTEGRLAAFLARHGEGPAAIWFLADGGAIGEVWVDRLGPFGPERLAPGGPVEDVLRFLVLAGPGTIRA